LYSNNYLALVLNKESWFLNSLNSLRNEKCNIYLKCAYYHSVIVNGLLTDSGFEQELQHCQKMTEFANITLQQNLSNTDSSQSSTVNLHQIVFDFCHHTLLANSADISDCVLPIALQQRILHRICISANKIHSKYFARFAFGGFKLSACASKKKRFKLRSDIQYWKSIVYITCTIINLIALINQSDAIA